MNGNKAGVDALSVEKGAKGFQVGAPSWSLQISSPDYVGICLWIEPCR